jgi:hypothetical protein
MTRQKSVTDSPVWLEPGGGGSGAFGGGDLWIGQHAEDLDILVFDPAEADPHADILSLYSLTQHRTRRFPRATVLHRVHELADELGSARARKDYATRAPLRAAHVQTLAAERTARMDRQRDGVVDAHRRYVEQLGVAYQGVRETAEGRRGRQRTKCPSCALALDDFAGKACAACEGVLCSCGACACRSAIRSVE